MLRIFVKAEQIADGKVRITGADVNHIRNVLRMRQGDEIEVSAGDAWVYRARLEELSDKEELLAEIVDAQKPGSELPSRLILCQCLPKKDKMDLIVQKAVELGASQIVPVLSKRVIVQLDARKAEARTKRWQTIAKSAAEQSMRMQIPEVQQPKSMEALISWLDHEQIGTRLIPYERAEDMQQTREVISKIAPGESVAILIGPEGGFEEAEVAYAKEHGFTPITLGRRILRTETAGLAALSILMYHLEA